MMFIFSCDGGNPPIIDVNYWAGNSTLQQIERRQEHLFIPCSDANFDNMVCMTYEDLQKLNETYINACSVWEERSKELVSKLKDCGLYSKENINKVLNCIK